MWENYFVDINNAKVKIFYQANKEKVDTSWWEYYGNLSGDEKILKKENIMILGFALQFEFNKGFILSVHLFWNSLHSKQFSKIHKGPVFTSHCWLPKYCVYSVAFFS